MEGDVLQKYVATAAADSDASIREQGLPTDHSDALASDMDRRKEQVRRWARHCATFRTPITRQAVWQIANSTVPLAALLALMFWTLSVSYPLTLVLALPAGGLLVRLFIIQHDCGHGSFFGSSRLNTVVGRAMSVFTLAPYALWRREHAIHHNGSGNLERRGVGDIETKTVAEYLASSSFERWRYRLYRNPLFLFGFGVPFYFLVIQRLPWFHGLRATESWRSVMSLNVAVTLLYGTLGWLLGFLSVALVALPVLVVASALGGWLFFIQHQFEETRWDAAAEWDFQVAAVYGSSHYVLPKPLQWLTGNIGLHHIHHLNSMVPNYRLQECMDALPELAHINRLTIAESLHCPKLTLWDETKRRLVSYRDAMSNATAAA
jgi:omega-6 fatty acid desaturase (delta-12 desaturase)